MPAGVKFPVDVVADPVNAAVSCTAVPVNDGAETVPSGVNVPDAEDVEPVNVALSSVPVPVNDG